MKPHKHAEYIHEWADGKEIQRKWMDGYWYDDPNPSWNPADEFRLKPQPKPDITAKFRIDRHERMGFYACSDLPNSNVKVIFDGETNQLKAVELIK